MNKEQWQRVISIPGYSLPRLLLHLYLDTNKTYIAGTALAKDNDGNYLYDKPLVKRSDTDFEKYDRVSFLSPYDLGFYQVSSDISFQNLYFLFYIGYSNNSISIINAHKESRDELLITFENILQNMSNLGWTLGTTFNSAFSADEMTVHHISCLKYDKYDSPKKQSMMYAKECIEEITNIFYSLDNFLISPREFCSWLFNNGGEKYIPKDVALILNLCENRPEELGKGKEAILQEVICNQQGSMRQDSIEYIFSQWEAALKEYEKHLKRANDDLPRIIRWHLHEFDTNVATACGIKKETSTNSSRDKKKLPCKISILKSNFPVLPDLPK